MEYNAWRVQESLEMKKDLKSFWKILKYEVSVYWGDEEISKIISKKEVLI